MFFQKPAKTFNSILAQFREAADDMFKLRDEKEAEASLKRDEAERLRAQAIVSDSEADGLDAEAAQADSVGTKIDALITPTV